MEIITITSEKAEVRLSACELETFKNALNEICHVLSASEFRTRIGTSHQESIRLYNDLLNVLEKLREINK